VQLLPLADLPLQGKPPHEAQPSLPQVLVQQQVQQVLPQDAELLELRQLPSVPHQQPCLESLELV
jgi:hypothetical protein